jgi:glycosyltransferase involved in cell wall biosynthesis
LINNHEVLNYEIQLRSNTGGGIKNIFQLVIYQILVLRWLLVNNARYDVIHAFDLDTGLPALVVKMLTRKNYVYHIADFYLDSRPGIPRVISGFIRKLEYAVISHAATTILCTEDRINQIQGSKPRRVVTIHNSPTEDYQDYGLIHNADNILTNKKSLSLCYVGGLEERRFIKQVLNIMSHNSSLKLDIAGLGELDNYVKAISNELPNVKYHGRIDYRDALKLYSNCDIMFAIYDPAVANHRYAAPNKVYEAMMLGKLIVVAKGTGIDKLVDEYGIGISIDYKEEEFENILIHLLNNPDLVFSMGKKARELYQQYSWKTMKRKLAEAYNDLEKICS